MEMADTYENLFGLLAYRALFDDRLDTVDEEGELGVQGLRRLVCLAGLFWLDLVRVPAVRRVWQLACCEMREICEGEDLRHGRRGGGKREKEQERV